MNSLEEKRKFYIDVVKTGDSLFLRDISDLCFDMLDFTNLRSGVFFFFFASLAREGKKITALLPKTDYRDKGRGHDRRLRFYRS